MRGERGISSDGIWTFAGSSPRARGTRDRSVFRRPSARFIPACAGSALSQPVPPAPPTVHPRVRGERKPGLSTPEYYAGSSPRARGTPSRRRQPHQQARFIPACAGNATKKSSTSTRWSVHPRVRGERSAPSKPYGPNVGSSPRARGTLAELRDAEAMLRFIPACAGNAASAAPSSTPCSVHPRVRGERLESSPTKNSCARFIPACAGNAVGIGSQSSSVTVHPRVRGERLLYKAHLRTISGSSPRARGTPRHRSGRVIQARFIPACAGNARTARRTEG